MKKILETNLEIVNIANQNLFLEFRKLIKIYEYIYKKTTDSKEKITYKHKNKISVFPYEWIKRIISIGIKIHVVGDYLNFFGVKNHGHLNHSKINLLQSRSKFSIASSENNLSIFTIECINNHNKIFINISKYIKSSKYKKIRNKKHI